MTKIMLVEDDKSLREIYGIRLIAEGYDIKSAGDGEEALAMAIKERPDLIISDVMMPKISGFDMLDILRATPETKDIKIIMMTALSSEDQRARGESLGANRYLVKSQVGIEDVVRAVHDVLTDTPVAAVPATQLFGSQVPSSTTSTPTQTFNLPAQPMSTSAPIAPVATTPTSTPIVNPTPEPVATPAPTMPMPPTPTPTPAINQPSMMPQPTAPFSSAAPASLGNSMMNQVQPVAPAPVINAPKPFTMPPQPMAVPTPVITAPQSVTQTPVSTYSSAPGPIQDVIVPRPATTPTPDIAAMMAQELNGVQPPQNPVQ